MGRYFYSLLAHSGGAQGSVQEPRGLWVSWVSPGSVAALCCSRAASSGSPENLTGSNVCFRRASQVSCASAKGKHHRFPADTHLIPPRNYQGKIGHRTVHVWAFPKPQLLHVSTSCRSGTHWFSQVNWWAATFSGLQANLPHLKGAHLYTLIILKQHLTN